MRSLSYIHIDIAFSHSLQISKPCVLLPLRPIRLHWPLSSSKNLMMSPSRFLALLLLTSLLSLSFTSGFGRSLKETLPRHHYTAKPDTTEEHSGRLRVMAQMMDYGDPEANTNPKYGSLLSPPPPYSLSPSPTP